MTYHGLIVDFPQVSEAIQAPVAGDSDAMWLDGQLHDWLDDDTHVWIGELASIPMYWEDMSIVRWEDGQPIYWDG
jgi:hypothetical protein